jgi:hypothetical protein
VSDNTESAKKANRDPSPTPALTPGNQVIKDDYFEKNEESKKKNRRAGELK